MCHCRELTRDGECTLGHGVHVVLLCNFRAARVEGGGGDGVDEVAVEMAGLAAEDPHFDHRGGREGEVDGERGGDGGRDAVLAHQR